MTPAMLSDLIATRARHRRRRSTRVRLRPGPACPRRRGSPRRRRLRRRPRRGALLGVDAADGDEPGPPAADLTERRAVGLARRLEDRAELDQVGAARAPPRPRGASTRSAASTARARRRRRGRARAGARRSAGGERDVDAVVDHSSTPVAIAARAPARAGRAVEILLAHLDQRRTRAGQRRAIARRRARASVVADASARLGDERRRFAGVYSIRPAVGDDAFA